MSEEDLPGDQNVEAAVPLDSNSDDHLNEQEQRVPLSALQSERAQRQELQDQLRMIEGNMALLQSQQYQQSQPPKKDEFDGLEDGDVLTVGEAKRFISRLDKKHNTSITELKVMQAHKDYQEVVTNYLPDVLKQTPGLQNTLKQTQDFELAYHLAKNSERYRTENVKKNKSIEAKRIVENSQKVGSVSSMGSTSPISQAVSYKNMSDEDFRAVVARNMGGI